MSDFDRWAWRDAWQHNPDIPGPVKLLLHALMTTRESKEGRCEQSMAWLASSLSVEKRAAQKRVKAAIRSGWVKRGPRREGFVNLVMSHPEGGGANQAASWNAAKPFAPANQAASWNAAKEAALPTRTRPEATSGTNVRDTPDERSRHSGRTDWQSHLSVQESKEASSKGAQGASEDAPGKPRGGDPPAEAAAAAASFQSQIPEDDLSRAVEIRLAQAQATPEGVRNPGGYRARLRRDLAADPAEVQRILNPPPEAEDYSERMARHFDREAANPSWLEGCYGEDAERKRAERRARDYQEALATQKRLGLPFPLTYSAPTPSERDRADQVELERTQDRGALAWLARAGEAEREEILGAARDRCPRLPGTAVAEVLLERGVALEALAEAPEVAGLSGPRAQAELDRLASGTPDPLRAAQASLAQGVTEEAPQGAPKRRTQRPVASRSGPQDPGNRGGDLGPAGALSARLRGHCSGSTPGEEEVA